MYFNILIAIIQWLDRYKTSVLIATVGWLCIVFLSSYLTSDEDSWVRSLLLWKGSASYVELVCLGRVFAFVWTVLREFFVENHLNMMETGFPIRIYHQDALGGTLQVLNHVLDSHAASNVLLQSASFHQYMFLLDYLRLCLCKWCWPCAWLHLSIYCRGTWSS